MSAGRMQEARSGPDVAVLVAARWMQCRPRCPCCCSLQLARELAQPSPGSSQVPMQVPSSPAQRASKSACSRSLECLPNWVCLDSSCATRAPKSLCAVACPLGWASASRLRPLLARTHKTRLPQRHRSCCCCCRQLTRCLQLPWVYAQSLVARRRQRR